MYNDPRLKNQYKVRLIISNFEKHPDELTKELGIEPTETIVKGEYRVTNKKTLHKMLNKHNLWILDSGLPSSVLIEDKFEVLLNKLKPFKEKLVKISRKYSLEIACAIYYYEANPGFNLSANILKEVAELNAKIGFDIYCLEGTVLQLKEDRMVNELVKELNEAKFSSDVDNEMDEKETRTLVNNLKELEEACYSFLTARMPELFYLESLSRDEFKTRFEKIGEDLKRIVNVIKQSKYLSSLINEDSSQPNDDLSK